ncbi:MAG: hypothetical protein ABEJ40_01755 [Haloarculaceae archaeon]
MGRQRSVALAVAALLLLAGCNSVPGTGGAATPTERVTPVPVETQTPGTPVPDALPPGVAPNGTVSTNALVAAHVSTLRERSFTWTVRVRLLDVSEGELVRGYRERVRRDESGTYLAELTGNDGRNRTIFTNGTGDYVRQSFPNFTYYQFYSDPINRKFVVTTAVDVRRYLESDSADLAVVDRDGRRLVRIHVTEPPEGVRERHPRATISNYTATAYVTPAGFVRTLAVEYEYESGSGRYHLRRRFDYTSVGETTVRAPGWTGSVRSEESVTPMPGDGTATGPAGNGTATGPAGNGTATGTSENGTATGTAGGGTATAGGWTVPVPGRRSSAG